MQDRDIPINRELVWDYPVPSEGCAHEGFRRWYIQRVLTRGGIGDIRSLGLDTIQNALPTLFLPRKISDFWRFYFNLIRS